MGEARRRKLLVADNSETILKRGATIWPLSNQGEQDKLEKWFTAHYIDFGKPGFHDLPTFLIAEQTNPRAMEFVARYVESRTYAENELLEAGRKIGIAAEAIASRVSRDGRPGLCVTAASGLSRMLDEMGIWNYTAKANVAVNFPAAAGSGSQYFYSVDRNMPEMPHAVVVAPPFTLIDPSIKFQAYPLEKMRASIPSLVISDELSAYRPLYRELVSPEIRSWLNLGNDENKLESYMRSQSPQMIEVMENLPPRQVHFGNGGSIRYAIVAASGFAEKLQDCVSPNSYLNGLSLPEIFKRDVLPFL